MSYKTGFKNGRLGIGIPSGGGDGNGDPLYPLDINGDIRLTGAIVKADGTIYSSGGGVGVKGLYSVQDSNTGKYKFGVGKSNPVYTLDVSGSLNLDGDIYVNGVSLSSGESTTASQALQTGDDPSWVSSVTTDLTSDILAPLNEEFDTLLEIANAVQDICNNNLVINLATKANKASPTFTGTVTIPDLNIGGGKLIREASSNDYGGIKINWNNGYANTGHKKYPVMLESGKAYVNVPWTDNNTTYSVGDGGLTTKNFTAALKTKLDGIATNANNYTYSLPQSSTTTIGGVKMSAPFYVQASTGKINCSNAASGQSGLMGWSDWRKLNHFTTDQNNTSGTGNVHVPTITTNHLNATGTQLTYTGSTNSMSYYDVVGHVYSIYDHGRSNGAFSGSGFSGNNWTKVTAINVNIDRMEVYQIVFYSDKRIKTNIEDVPDHLALETVRNIPCRYYNYRDNEKFNNRYKTIGFIAQEVAEVFPEAILKEKGIIPNIGIFLTNGHNTNLFSWEHDVSNNNWKLTIPTINDLIIDNSDNIYEKCKVKFVVTTKNEDDYKKEINDASGDLIKISEIKEKYKKEEKEIILEIEDDLQSFIFDKKWDNVFLYGTEVKDLLTVDKQKIFALHHSAIQEIDLQQQIDKAKIAELESENQELKTEVATLKSELATIKAHLGI